MRAHVVPGLAVVSVRETPVAPNHLGEGAAVHRGLVRNPDYPTAHANPKNNSVALVSHLNACLRHHCCQFLQIMEFLSSYAFPSVLLEGAV